MSRGVKRGRGSKADEDGFEVVPIQDPGKRFVQSGERNQSKLQRWGSGFDFFFVFTSLVKYRILDPEGLALGAVIASSKKAKRDLIDNSFNR